MRIDRICLIVGALILATCVIDTVTRDKCDCSKEVKSLRDDVNQLTVILSEQDDEQN